MSGVFLSIGAGPGISLSTARRFAAEGYRVVLAARSLSKLQKLADLIKKSPNSGVEVVVLDCANTKKVADVINSFATNLKVIHYNSAVIRIQKLPEQATNTIIEDMTVNVTSALVTIKYASKALEQNGGGTILLTGGILAVKPMSSLLTLSVGKAALRCAAQALFSDLSAKNIHIALLTISSNIEPGSENAEEIGKAFWNMHAQPYEEWTWEENYG